VYDGGLSSFSYYYVQMIEPFMSYHIMHSLFCRRVHHVYAAPARYLPLQHNQSDSAHVFRTRLVPRIDTTGDGRRAVVVEVVVQRSVACAKLLIFEEERVVEEGESVEDVEASLVTSVSHMVSIQVDIGRAHLVRQNQRVLHQCIQSCLELCIVLLKRDFCRVVE
jgi:hypothetical protein